MNNLHLDRLSTSYDNNVFIHVDVLGDGNSFSRNDFIPCGE